MYTLLCQFVLADAASEPNFQPVGVVIICGALVADAFVGNTQESLLACVAWVARCMHACPAVSQPSIHIAGH